MSEVLSGARYTFGALVVLTLWSIGVVQFVEWKLERQAEALAAEVAAHEDMADDALLRLGPDRGASDETRARYYELKRLSGLE